MIRRWRMRLAAAERARFGAGLLGLVRRLLAREQGPWPIWQERTFAAIAWRVLPRRVAVIALGALGIVFVSLAAIGLGLIVLVLQAV